MSVQAVAPNREIVVATVHLFAAVVRNIHLKRVLHAVDPNPNLTFWRLIYGDLMDLAVIDWCKLFGSDDKESQPSHWKNMIPEAAHDDFRRGLWQHLGITKDQWQIYRQDVVDFRNNYAAHFSPPWLQRDEEEASGLEYKYPDFSIALEAVYYYYSKLLVRLRNLGYTHSYPEDLKDYCAQYVVQTRTVAFRAISGTAGMIDTIT